MQESKINKHISFLKKSILKIKLIKDIFPQSQTKL
jgi:hypothetical protein